jgi:heat shock protein HslJ/uncharacterized lipoprotein NlpE involved in copper resistance
MFTSDRVHQVLTRGATDKLDILLRRMQVPREGAAMDPDVIEAHGLRLPATFKGNLACADCPGVRHHLDLWPDQVFHLHREWLDKGVIRDDVGRWDIDPSRNALVLRGSERGTVQFAIKGPNTLRLLDSAGKPIVSELPYELVSTGSLEPAELSLRLRGMMSYMADAARFKECLSGRSYPVALEKDFAAMEQAYREQAQTPGAELMVQLEAGIRSRRKPDVDTTKPTVVVERFIRAWPLERCERALVSADLTNTYWRLVRLDGSEVKPIENRREPHLLLRSDEPRYTATVGCNQIIGTFSLKGESIEFGKRSAATRMACPPPLDVLEQRLLDVLGRTVKWRIDGSVLELADTNARELALLQAVYLR